MTRHFSLTARAALLSAAAAALTACGGGGGGVNLREAVGVDKNPPDAFAVVRHGRDLEMPETLDALPAPDADARSRMRPNPEQDAIRALRQESAAAPASYAPQPYGSQAYALQAPSGGPAPASFPASFKDVVGQADESALLGAVGAANAPQDIRAVVDSEAAAAQAQRVEYPLERVLPILRDMRGDTLGDPLDPVEEYRRSGTLPTQ